LDVLSRLADGGYDLVFLDGEPHEAETGYVEALRLLRPGGLVVLAGVLADGKVADPAQRDATTIALRTLVSAIREDVRVRPVLFPLGGGLLVGQKIAPSES
jgi:predicted O-methyltransferase YrrM